jgi:tetratricopeptide (TPR) repeat protein
MKFRLIVALLVSCSFAAGAKPKNAPIPAVTAEPATGVEAAIPSPVKALGEPAMIDFPSGIQMAVTAATEKAQAHVNQGLNHLHSGWEFEASRHFAAALREDPECLLAHWGMLMTMLTPSPETDAARMVVTTRMLDLIDQGKGSELERSYAYALIKYLEDGPARAANAFRWAAEKFPNDLQAGIFAALFSRGGYDEFGTATPDQQAAEQSLLALIAKNPQSPLPLNALLTIRAEGPDLSSSLDLARKLCEIVPNYQPYLRLLGHYEWRCGHHTAAAATFERAGAALDRWMKDNKTSVADCPEWANSECYRIVALTSKGDLELALPSARKLAAIPFPKNRAFSPGARAVLWEAKTLPARVLLYRGQHGDAAAALSSLPKPEETKDTRDKSLAYWWIDGLRLNAEGRRLVDEGKVSEAREVAAAINHHSEKMLKQQNNAAANGERSAWNRAFSALDILGRDLHGRIELANPKNGVGTAYNWFAGAADLQHPAVMMYPPVILTPMAARLGDYYLITNRPKDAIEAYDRALTAFPNDMSALLGLKTAYEKSDLPDEAALTAKKIADLRTH